MEGELFILFAFIICCFLWTSWFGFEGVGLLGFIVGALALFALFLGLFGFFLFLVFVLCRQTYMFGGIMPCLFCVGCGAASFAYNMSWYSQCGLPGYFAPCEKPDPNELGLYRWLYNELGKAGVSVVSRDVIVFALLALLTAVAVCFAIGFIHLFFCGPIYFD